MFVEIKCFKGSDLVSMTPSMIVRIDRGNDVRRHEGRAIGAPSPRPFSGKVPTFPRRERETPPCVGPTTVKCELPTWVLDRSCFLLTLLHLLRRPNTFRSRHTVEKIRVDRKVSDEILLKMQKWASIRSTISPDSSGFLVCLSRSM